jgi:hypothetical protein
MDRIDIHSETLDLSREQGGGINEKEHQLFRLFYA